MHPGFTITNQMTNIEIQLHSSELEHSYPLVTMTQQDSYVALLMGRIYYQHELLIQLEKCNNISFKEEYTTNAAALALATYIAFGTPSLARLEGDFALAIWDAKQKHLLGMRDPLGGYPLFWTAYADTFALSTSLWSLLNMQPHCSLNEDYFAEFLMMPIQRDEGSSESCAYAGIRRILPGTMVTLKSCPNSVERHRYWQWFDQIKDPGTDDITELASQYRLLLKTAVRERLQGRVLGGMQK